MAETTLTPRDRVERWLDRAVIDLGLCPFAAPVRDALAIECSSCTDLEDAFAEAMALVDRMLDAEPAALPTALLVLVANTDEFEDFLDLVAALEDALEDCGASEWLQLATFHPEYRFADTDPDEPGNFTNRAPYPILHLLRVDDVADAVARHPDTEAIPERNVARLETLGRAGIDAVWSTFMPRAERH